jgi:hypothetical protein
MKTLYKNSLYLALSTLCCLFLAFTASAQRDDRPSSSGGGGSRPATSSSSSSARPPGGGGSRPAVSVSRPPANVQRNNTIAPRRGPVYVDRQGNVIKNNGVTTSRNTPGYVPRTGVNPNGATYRTAPQVGYNRSATGYWGSHGYNHYNHGYYNSYYLPRLGFTIGVLPYGYYPFYFGDLQYFYSSGLYYEYENSQYTVVEPPLGAEITSLPQDAQAISINGQQYYELNGVYYQPTTKDDGTVVYVIAGKDGELNTDTDNNTVQDQQPQGPQIGDIVNQLPPNCKKISLNGQKLYLSPDGVYYQQQVDDNGNTMYKIVGLPSDDPNQN